MQLCGAVAQHLDCPQDEEVDQLNPAYHTNAHAEPHEPANVAEQLEPGEPLLPLLLHVVELLEVDVNVGHIVRHICVVQEFGMFL